MMKEKPVLLYGDCWKNVFEILKQDSDKLAELIERNVKIISKPEEVFKILADNKKIRTSGLRT